MLIPSSALFDIRPFSARAAMTNLKRKRHNRSREEDASASAASVGPPCCLLVLLKAVFVGRTAAADARTHFRNSMGGRDRASGLMGARDPSEIRGLTVMCAFLGAGQPSNDICFLFKSTMCDKMFASRHHQAPQCLCFETTGSCLPHGLARDARKLTFEIIRIYLLSF